MFRYRFESCGGYIILFCGVMVAPWFLEPMVKVRIFAEQQFYEFRNMGKSRKKTPIFGICGGSEKGDKRIANRKFRRITKDKISHNQIDKLPYDMNEIVNVWSMSKDGKYYWKKGLVWKGGIMMRK